MAQMVEHLSSKPSKCKALSSSLSSKKEKKKGLFLAHGSSLK
jgi:hypothetical protein